MASNFDKLLKLQRENPNPKYALNKATKELKRSPNDPCLLTWKASLLLKLDGRATEALPILDNLCQRQPPITDPQLLSFIYASFLNATRQVSPGVLALVSVNAGALKAWQNAAKTLSHRKAKLKLWSGLFVAAMKEECWEDVKVAMMQANKEGIDPKFKKVMYYSKILASQLGGEQRIAIAKAANKDDPGSQIQLDVTLRQMKDAYDSSPKPTDEIIRVSSMSDLRFMAAIYQRQNRCAELFQLWDNPSPAVQRIIDGASWDFALLKIEVAHGQKEWQLVETTCYQLIDNIYKAGNPRTGDPAKARAAMIDICTMGWTMWKSLLDATTHLYPEVEGKNKIRKLFSGIWESLPPRDRNTYRAFGLTRLSMEAYYDAPTLHSIIEFYFDCYRNPSCFKDLRRFVALLPVEEQRKFHAVIVDHAQGLGAKIAEEGTLAEDVQKNIREWHEAETTVLKFEFLMIVSLVSIPDVATLEDFVGNALRLWRVQLDAEGTEAMCDSDSLLVAVEALIKLFEVTAHPQYLYQAATLTRYSLSLDKNCHSKNTALLSTRLHLRLGLGTFAFEHYNRVQVKEMLHDNVAWVALSRISQSHPYGASGSRGFSADDELKKVIATSQRMEEKIDDLLYRDMHQFIYDKAFDLLELKRKLRTSLTKQFCILERRRIARLAGAAVDRSLDLPLRELEDISDNCHWDAILGHNHTRLGGIRNTHIVLPITKSWVYYHRTLFEVVNGIAFKEISPGGVTPSMAPYTAMRDAIAASEDPNGAAHYTPTESDLMRLYWLPIAYILQAIQPTGEDLPVFGDVGSLQEALACIFNQLKIDSDELLRDCKEDADAAFRSLPHLTEDGLNGVYGRLEVLRALNRLLDFLRPISKKTSHPFHKQVTVADCEKLQETVRTTFNLHRTRLQTVMDRLNKSGVARIKAQILHGKTGEAISKVIAGGVFDSYPKEYVNSAMEALKGVFNVQLG